MRDYPLDYLTKVVSRVRSDRPLVHQTVTFEIGTLRMRGLLNGAGGTWTGPETSISTKIKVNRGMCRYQVQTFVYVLNLESSPSVCGPAWYFVDAESGARVKTISFVGPVATSLKNQGALYPSQYQSKAHRKMLKLAKLTLAIEGDREGKGPARGQSRLRKLALLRATYNDLRRDQRSKEKAIVAFPQFKTTYRRAGAVLRRELPKLTPGWDLFESSRRVR